MLCWYQTKVCQIAEFLYGIGGGKQITKILVYAALLINVLFLSSAISSFVYGTVYLYHRPEMYHKIPVHFNYKRFVIIFLFFMIDLNNKVARISRIYSIDFINILKST